ncbi:hypothetical protein EDEG_02877 [Edhazardia aedis USNM 41457]|uniref:Uncharacterized protein n=1 Tax=Edhazardia aedis (strain USNM 41457) TaxID=1003232 RepID=J9D5B5_EDHAE|nr:hypothetical protein EDEG_02877 [Edhazardia aedis USNM 41457]|eukprot:EJW02724.1 hypothetical protein EDEG_02877 [Edhazardia aedis USNM 41457]
MDAGNKLHGVNRTIVDLKRNSMAMERYNQTFQLNFMFNLVYFLVNIFIFLSTIIVFFYKPDLIDSLLLPFVLSSALLSYDSWKLFNRISKPDWRPFLQFTTSNNVEFLLKSIATLLMIGFFGRFLYFQYE